MRGGSAAKPTCCTVSGQNFGMRDVFGAQRKEKSWALSTSGYFLTAIA
jgi:hypothetical protein